MLLIIDNKSWMCNLYPEYFIQFYEITRWSVTLANL